MRARLDRLGSGVGAGGAARDSAAGRGGGIAISASHSKIYWNALRFLGPSGIYLNTAEAGELIDIYHLRRFRYEEWNRLGKLTVVDTAIDA